MRRLGLTARRATIEPLDEYYALRGWDADGVPVEGTLGRLGIGDVRGRPRAEVKLTCLSRARIADAQREFLEKRHVGEFVLIPESPER